MRRLVSSLAFARTRQREVATLIDAHERRSIETVRCMIRIIIAGVILILTFGGCLHPTPARPETSRPHGRFYSTLRYPFLEVKSDPECIRRVEDDPLASPPWLRSRQRAPIRLRDLGLSGKLSLVDCGRGVSDPAFRVLISDEHGHLFAFCATRGNDYNGYGDSFVLGALRPSRKLEKVELGTKSYQFLFSLLWSFSRATAAVRAPPGTGRNRGGVGRAAMPVLRRLAREASYTPPAQWCIPKPVREPGADGRAWIIGGACGASRTDPV
jgi:hypothetical protein